MSDEAAFLAHIRANPSDALCRLVYADWLEEQGDDESARKAAFLRAEHELSARSADEKNRDALVTRLRKLAKHLPVPWKSAVARVSLENCGLKTEFECPKTWDQLQETGENQVRFCSACKRTVQYCGTIDEAKQQAFEGQCVAIDIRVLRRPGDLTPPPVDDEPAFLGGIMMEEPAIPRRPWWKFW